MVIATPTASGKTLIATLAILKKILKEKKKGLYLVPLRSIAAEKYREYRALFDKLNLKTAISTGDFDISPTWLGKNDLIICTNEKADSMLRHNPSWLSEIGIVIVDEIHLIHTVKRGPVIELLIAKLLKKASNAQIMCLSATIKNVNELASWLNADYILSDWRPVKLKEGVFYRHKIYWSDGMQKIKAYTGDQYADLSIDTINSGGQVLIFLSTRRSTVSLSKKIKNFIGKTLSINEKKALKNISRRIEGYSEGSKLTDMLSSLVKEGVAFHHAGLRYEHRDIIEEAFRDNLIKVICATPTLAAGVNLPARRVIIGQIYRYSSIEGNKPITIMEYKQMSGRAGRPKFDEYGESIIMASTEEKMKYLIDKYIDSPPERIESKLFDSKVIRSQVLSLIASGLAFTYKEVKDVFQSTLYGHQFPRKRFGTKIKESLDFLKQNGFIKEDDGLLYATVLGRRISLLYIDPLTAITMIKGLGSLGDKRRTAFSFLSLICLTPDMDTLSPRKKHYEELYEALYSRGEEIPLEINLWELPYPEINVHRSTWTALILEKWINEESEDTLNFKYDVGPGDVRRIAETADWLLYSLQEIASIFGYTTVKPEINNLRTRVRYGVKEELLQLTSLHGVGRVRARSLFNKGFKTYEDLQRADVKELSAIPSIGEKLARKIKQQLENFEEALPGEYGKISEYM